jgi:hypothetical protein
MPRLERKSQRHGLRYNNIEFSEDGLAEPHHSPSEGPPESRIEARNRAIVRNGWPIEDLG